MSSEKKIKITIAMLQYQHIFYIIPIFYSVCSTTTQLRYIDPSHYNKVQLCFSLVVCLSIVVYLVDQYLVDILTPFWWIQFKSIIPETTNCNNFVAGLIVELYIG